MAALDTGIRAPQIDLPLLNGGRFSLGDELAHGRVVLAFFKVSCPVCQMAFPYFERLNKRVEGKGIRFIGVSQDDAASTKAFCKEFGVTFPVVLDGNGYPVSNSYGLTNVPTVFVIGQDGVVERSVVGWSKREMEEIYAPFTDSQNATHGPLFRESEEVPEFKFG